MSLLIKKYLIKVIFSFILFVVMPEQERIVSTPDILGPKQNFFDQFPFTDLMESLSDPNITPQMRNLLFNFSLDVRRDLTFDQPHLSFNTNQVNALQKRIYQNKLTPRYMDIFNAIEDLNAYPFIFLYIQSQLMWNEDFTHTGERQQLRNAGEPRPQSSYLAWLQSVLENTSEINRLTIERMITEVGPSRRPGESRFAEIEGIIPQRNWRVRRIIRQQRQQ